MVYMCVHYCQSIVLTLNVHISILQRPSKLPHQVTGIGEDEAEEVTKHHIVLHMNFEGRVSAECDHTSDGYGS